MAFQKFRMKKQSDYGKRRREKNDSIWRDRQRKNKEFRRGN